MGEERGLCTDAHSRLYVIYKAGTTCLSLACHQVVPAVFQVKMCCLYHKYQNGSRRARAPRARTRSGLAGSLLVSPLRHHLSAQVFISEKKTNRSQLPSLPLGPSGTSPQPSVSLAACTEPAVCLCPVPVALSLDPVLSPTPSWSPCHPPALCSHSSGAETNVPCPHPCRPALGRSPCHHANLFTEFLLACHPVPSPLLLCPATCDSPPPRGLCTRWHPPPTGGGSLCCQQSSSVTHLPGPDWEEQTACSLSCARSARRCERPAPPGVC